MLLAGSAVVNVTLTVGSAAATGPTATKFTDPAITGPVAIAPGPDGNLWFTNLGFDTHGVPNNYIGRITPSGTITRFTDPGITGPSAIVAGPDGAMWFTDNSDGIGRITMSGTVTRFTDSINVINTPNGIAVGADGALWFTNQGNSVIGRVTTTGTFTHFNNPSISNPVGITAGPDGALWFVNNSNHSIGRITTSGVVSNFTDPSIVSPIGITTGPDGALWFTNENNNSIGRITTSGTVTNFTHSGIYHPQGIVAGSDGALWFTNFATSIGRITTSGAVSTFTGPNIDGPLGITAGPDGALWFTNGDSIGRITVGDRVMVPGNVSVVEGNSGTTDLHLPVTLSFASTQTITADWTTQFVPGAAGNQADPATDYTATSGTVTFAPGDTSQTVTISINGDSLVEPDEYIVVAFTNPTNVKMGGFFGLGFAGITNDDHATIVPGGASVLEGNSGTTNLVVPVTLSNPSTQTITAHWATSFVPGAPPSEADPASDYTATSGTVTFAPGQTSQTITISVNGDTQAEPDEYILIPFSSPTNARLGGFYGIGFGGITNDD